MFVKTKEVSVRKKYILTFVLSGLFSFLGADCVQDRPVLPLPDAHNDRMEKVKFTGTIQDPKYWLYKVTVVKEDFEYINRLGFQSTTKAGRFVFTRDKLKFNNLVTRQSLEKPDIANKGIEELVNEWDIQHSEIRLKEIDGWTVNQEEENKYLKWNEKGFFTVDWEKADISEASSFPYYVGFYHERACWKKAGSRLIDNSRQVDEDYITWTVAVSYEQKPACAGMKAWVKSDYVKTVHYKYSFKSIPDPRLKDENYTPYVYTGEDDPLFKKYGYFRTVRPAIAEDNRDKNIFYMNRWNPNKKHIFYFSEDYVEEYKDIAHGVICAANKLFARNGLSDYPLDGLCREDGSVIATREETCTKGICFELRENAGQKLGDIRYSFFTLTSLPTIYFGLGPHDKRPDTGEIVSGNVFASIYHLDFYLKYYLQDLWKRDLENYIDEDGNRVEGAPTKYKDASLFVRMRESLDPTGQTADPWTPTSTKVDHNSSIRLDFEYLLQRLTFRHPSASPFVKNRGRGPEAQDFTDGVALMFSPIRSIAPFFQNGPLKLEAQAAGLARLRQMTERFRQHSLKEALSQSAPNGTIYPIEPVLSQLPALLANGMKPEEIKRRILFNLMTHEFGHILNLRHNFYGSFDTHQHPRNHERKTILKSSSIMDYMNIKDEAEGPPKAMFGPYDEAALVYAYSGGEKDLSKEKGKRNYLFCTDEHAYLNFLCNRWDRGGTPSEVMMGLIEQYEESYFVRNLRAGRAWWDTRSYTYGIFQDFFNIKKALMMWRTAFNNIYINELLDESSKNYTEDDKNFISEEIQDDIRQALKLSTAFYNAVIQLSRAERDWQSHYNEITGAVERIGIEDDKLFAMYFLMGDEGFTYNPNHFLGKASYLTYLHSMGFAEMLERIFENNLTVRVDMDPWFINLGRYLYAKNSDNIYNRDNFTLLDKIAVRSYSPEALKRAFGIDPQAFQARPGSPPDILDTAVINMEDWLEDITDPYYAGTNEKLGVTYFNGCYYTASSNINKYSFPIIDRMVRQTHANGGNLGQGKNDIYDMFYLYNQFKLGTIPQNCGDGS